MNLVGDLKISNSLVTNLSLSFILQGFSRNKVTSSRKLVYLKVTLQSKKFGRKRARPIFLSGQFCLKIVPFLHLVCLLHQLKQSGKGITKIGPLLGYHLTQALKFQ
jgi:hypothetical protein